MNYKKLSIGLFFAIIVLLPTATFLLPKDTFSEMENRMLAKPPNFSFNNFQNKTFMNDWESFISDHMVFRNEFASAKTKLELLQGRREVNGVFISNNMLLEKINEPTEAITNSNIDAMNKFAAKYKGKLETSVMLVPTASEVYTSQIPELVNVQNQTKYIKDYYAKLKNINTIDTCTPLAAVAENNYVFYRTDHHWTSYGAYIGYAAMGKQLGFKPVTIDMFNIEHTTQDFLGTLYSKVIYGEKLADKIDIYYLKSEVVTDVIKYTAKNTQTYPSILFRENLEKKDKYTVFLGGNDPVVRIKTNVKNGKKIIIFKDSFAHSLMQFLPLHYEEIALIDLRYLNKPLDEYIDMKEYQQALFMYNMAGFVSDGTVKKVSTY